jgi:predicted Zn-dependent protease
MKTPRKQPLSALFLALWLAGCAQPTTQTPYFDPGAVAQEEAVQRAYAERGQEIRNTPYTEQELAQMEQRLATLAPRIVKAGQTLCGNMGRDPQSCTYTIRLSTDDHKNLNAYANGTEIFVTPPMMRFANTNDKLGTVLSHEYAHNIMGHVQAKQRNAMAGLALGTIADMIASSQGYNTGGALSNLGVDQGIRAFSPDFEREADYVGLYVMALAGFDIAEAPKLWRDMTAADPEGAFLTGSHPSNPERYILLDHTKNEIVQKVKAGQMLVPNVRPET